MKATDKDTPLTQDRLRALLQYDPLTGIFLWAVNRKGVKIGDVAGCRCSDHWIISVDGRGYYAHRLAWLYMTGKWPDPECDHENGVGDDNRWENLRECTHPENMQNISILPTNTSGFPGVSPSGKRWRAHIRVRGKQLYLGSFETAAEAGVAYLEAKARLHTFNPTVRAA
jgi:hypothetical protein